MRRELKVHLSSIIPKNRSRHKAYPDEKGTESPPLMRGPGNVDGHKAYPDEKGTES